MSELLGPEGECEFPSEPGIHYNVKNPLSQGGSLLPNIPDDLLREYYHSIQPDQKYRDLGNWEQVNGIWLPVESVGPSAKDLAIYGFGAGEGLLISPGWPGLVKAASKSGVLRAAAALGALFLGASNLLENTHPSEASGYAAFNNLPGLDVMPPTDVTPAELQPDLGLKEINGVDKDGNRVEFIQFYDGRGTGADKDSKPVIVWEIFPQGWANDEAGLKAAKQAFLEGLLQTSVFKDYADKYLFIYRKQNTLENLQVRQSGIIDNADGYFKAIESSISALAPMMSIPVHTTTFTKSLDGTPNGRSDGVFDRLNKPASPRTASSVVYPETDTPTKWARRVVAHETLWIMGVEAPKTPKEFNDSITGNGFEWLPRDKAWVEWLFASNNGNYSARFQTPEFSTLSNIRPGYSLSRVGSTEYRGVSIPVDFPVVTTQYRLGVYPSKNPFTGEPDGPAIELTIGDRKLVADVIQNERIFIPAPQKGVGNYILLPDQYTYQLCITADPTSLPWDPISGWEKPIPIWPTGLTVTNNCKEGGFNTRTAQMPTSRTIHPIGLENGSLRWRNDDPTIFYYEIQVSKDEKFNKNPGTATSFVWENLVHGGVTDNSWKMPPVEPGTKLFWRMRPRIQGQGIPVDWSDTWSFTVQ